jgi:hypothetical protein
MKECRFEAIEAQKTPLKSNIQEGRVEYGVDSALETLLVISR